MNGMVMNDATVGMDLGGTTLVLRCGDTEDVFSTGLSFTPKQLISCLGSFLQRHEIRPRRMGLAVPGLLDSDGRVTECDVLPTFRGWHARLAMDELCPQTVVLNDVRAALITEMHDALPDVTGGVIVVGTAVGAAFIAHGRPLLGTNGWAGELGYLPLMMHNGQARRLDDLAGGAAIAARCNMTPEALAVRTTDGDSAILQIISEAGTALGLGLAAIINLLNPSILRVGGGTSELPGYWEATLVAAKRHALAELWQDCTLVRARTGKKAVVLGAIRAANCELLASQESLISSGRI